MSEQYIGAPPGARFHSARAGTADGAIITWSPAESDAPDPTPGPAGWKELGEIPEWIAVDGSSERRLTVPTAGLMAVRAKVAVSVPVELRGREHEVYTMGFAELPLAPPPVGAIKPRARDPQLFLRTQHWRWFVGWHDLGQVTGWASLPAPAVAADTGPEFVVELDRYGGQVDVERFLVTATWGVSAPASMPTALTIQLGEDRQAPHPKTIRPLGWQFGPCVVWGLGR